MAGAMKWNGPQMQARIEAEMKRRLAASGIVVQNHAKELVSIEGAGGSRAQRNSKGQFIKGTGSAKLRYGANPSSPGDPPHKQTGRLLGSIATEPGGMIQRVGTNLKYGRWLELGTTKMAARPWLRRALNERLDAIRRLLTAKMF